MRRRSGYVAGKGNGGRIRRRDSRCLFTCPEAPLRDQSCMITAADDIQALIAEAEAITGDAAAKAEAKARRQQLREESRRKKAEQRKRKAAEQAERERERKAEEERLRAEAEEARKVLLRKAAALRDAAGGSIRDCFEG